MRGVGGAEKAVGVEGTEIGFSQCLPIVSLVSLVTVGTTQGSDPSVPSFSSARNTLEKGPTGLRIVWAV